MARRSLWPGQRTVVVAVAIVFAVPASLLSTLAPWPGLSWFALVTVGVVVPSVYGYQWPDTEHTGLALAATVTACGVAFGGLVVSTAAVGALVGPGLAPSVAFLLVGIGGPLLVEGLLRKGGVRD